MLRNLYKKHKEKIIAKQVDIFENNIYLLQPSCVRTKITEEEFNDVLKEVSQSNLTTEDCKHFIDNTLPFVVEIDKYGIELVHHLVCQIKDLEKENK